MAALVAALPAAGVLAARAMGLHQVGGSDWRELCRCFGLTVVSIGLAVSQFVGQRKARPMLNDIDQSVILAFAHQQVVGLQTDEFSAIVSPASGSEGLSYLGQRTFLCSILCKTLTTPRCTEAVWNGWDHTATARPISARRAAALSVRSQLNDITSRPK
jgi:hypothetical protein